MKTICIMCPKGCGLEIEQTSTGVVVSNNECKRGKIYGENEFLHPTRNVASLVYTKSGCVVSVKTTNPIPKEMVMSVARELKLIKVENNVLPGDIICKNILDSGADIVCTGTQN